MKKKNSSRREDCVLLYTQIVYKYQHKYCILCIASKLVTTNHLYCYTFVYVRIKVIRTISFIFIEISIVQCVYLYTYTCSLTIEPGALLSFCCWRRCCRCCWFFFIKSQNDRTQWNSGFIEYVYFYSYFIAIGENTLWYQWQKSRRRRQE